jgi:hypothetical protein
MSEYFPEYSMCSTAYPGLVNGTHPTKIGIEKNVEIVFGGDGNLMTYGEITNCGDFYVYNLDDTPGCNEVYCATFN